MNSMTKTTTTTTRTNNDHDDDDDDEQDDDDDHDDDARVTASLAQQLDNTNRRAGLNCKAPTFCAHGLT
jgi:hypothetical protein